MESIGSNRLEDRVDKLLNAKQIASWLDIPLSSVYEKTRRNEIPHVRLGRSVRYHRDSIAKFINDGGTV